MVTKKVTNFISGSIFLPSVRHLVGGLIRPIVKWYPTDILKCLLSQTCESIKQILDKTDISQINNPNGDLELNWYLILFAELVQARGDTLLIYQENIKSVFHRCIRILHKDSYQAIALAIKSLLLSLLNIYSISRSLTRENEDDSFVNFLPIRAWGQNVDFDRIQVQYHIPNDEEIDFACDFVNTFMYPELTLLKENFQKISKDERRRSLAIVYSIAVGCLRIVPRMESKEIQDIALTLVPCKLESHSLYPTYYKQSSSKFRENIRMRLLLDIGQLLDMLIENQSDDVVSIKNALSIYVLPTRYYGTSSYNVSQMRRNVQSTRKLFRNEIIGERDNPVCLVMNQIELQIEEFELYSYRILTEIDKQVELKLFDLSINRYSEVRRYAQLELFFFLVRHYNSWEVIVDRVADLLNSSKDTDDNEIKGCLHILNGDSSFFLLTKNSWTMMKKLWPAIVRRSPMKKLSVQRLIQEIKKKIETQFFTIALVDEINQVAVQAASTLWRPLESNEIQIGIEIREKRHRINIQSYNHLIDDLCLLLNDQTLQALFHWILFMFIIFLEHFSDHGDRKRSHAVKAIAAFCRLQKLPLTYVEKSLDEIFPGIDRSTTTGIQNRSQPGNRDDNLWLTYNDYKAPETQTEWEQICFLDKIFHGYYQWPKTIKYALNKRERYTGGEIPTHVSIILDRFLDKDFVTKLINHSGSSVELDIEARQALNLIETVIEFHLNLFDRCNEPIKEIIVQLFPYLCEIESIVTNDDTFRKRLTIARTRIGMAYLHVHLLETLIQQLEYVCTTRKWHARRSAIEFVQNLVFCNLFNVRCYAKRLHQLVYKCLCDEQLEVRLIASKTLSGFYQCGYLTVTEDDLKHFLEMSNTNYFTESDGKKVISTKDTVRRHSGMYFVMEQIIVYFMFSIPSL
ncbi:unnamed protein product [Rotaria magnacalcarata]|uniref:Uncharacterized protein n=1 Tax=Rotaria magnacalcarata TaxID=392030 RepID=A0A8S2QHA9_9BILA|nr:unnamed protein product [Rotaria magnacalcarata]